MAEILTELPRFYRLWKLFPMAKELEKAVIGVYQDVVDFFLFALAYFCSHPLSKLSLRFIHSFNSGLDNAYFGPINQGIWRGQYSGVWRKALKAKQARFLVSRKT
jgi:hypothetical protein